MQDIAADVMGLGPIEQFLHDPTVNEVMVNGSNHIYVERSGVIEQTKVRFISEDHLRRVIERIVSSVGRRIDEASPMVDARLADGSRVNVIVPPLSLDGVDPHDPEVDGDTIVVDAGHGPRRAAAGHRHPGDGRSSEAGAVLRARGVGVRQAAADRRHGRAPLRPGAASTCTAAGWHTSTCPRPAALFVNARMVSAGTRARCRSRPTRPSRPAGGARAARRLWPAPGCGGVRLSRAIDCGGCDDHRMAVIAAPPRRPRRGVPAASITSPRRVTATPRTSSGSRCCGERIGAARRRL